MNSYNYHNFKLNKYKKLTKFKPTKRGLKKEGLRRRNRANKDEGENSNAYISTSN